MARSHLSPVTTHQPVARKSASGAMERMGFGLAIAPKFMDVIVKWILRDIIEADNYVDDLFVPKDRQLEAEAKLAEYGLHTKPAEALDSARVLGLQLNSEADASTTWRRREQDLTLPASSTKRQLFSWCGKVIKRLSCDEVGWDEVVPEAVRACCRDISLRLKNDDPVHGVWYASLNEHTANVWFDASDLAYGSRRSSWR